MTHKLIAALINDRARGISWANRHLKMGHSPSYIYNLLDNLPYGVTYAFDRAVTNVLETTLNPFKDK